MSTWSAVRLYAGYDWHEVEAWLVDAEKAAERNANVLIRGEVQMFLTAVAFREGCPQRQSSGRTRRSDISKEPTR